MIKKARRVFAAVVAVLLVCFTAAPALSANAATQNSWNFKNSNFKKLGTIKYYSRRTWSYGNKQ